MQSRDQVLSFLSSGVRTFFFYYPTLQIIFGGGLIICQFTSGCRSLFLSYYETHAHLLGIAYSLIEYFAIFVVSNSQRATKASINKSFRKLVK